MSMCVCVYMCACAGVDTGECGWASRCSSAPTHSSFSLTNSQAHPQAGAGQVHSMLSLLTCLNHPELAANSTSGPAFYFNISSIFLLTSIIILWYRHCIFCQSLIKCPCTACDYTLLDFFFLIAQVKQGYFNDFMYALQLLVLKIK